MKALFITTQTADCENHVSAWDSLGEAAEHLTFNHHAIRNDWRFLERARELKPEIIFYIGAYKAPGNPRPETFRELRALAPVVLICSDATDRPWHPVLAGYRTRGCFDLTVGIDGGLGAPVDLATLTPVDPRPFEGDCARDVRCGFSGSVGRWNARSETVLALKWFGGLTVRSREGAYEDHVRFMKRCQMVLNISFTGSQHAHHIKGRVIEAGFAGCALLESEGSPIGDWFPDDCYITWKDPIDAAQLIASVNDEAIEKAAKRLAEEVRRRYTAKTIYGEILDHLNVDHSIPRPAA